MSYVVDIELDGIEATKIHCISYHNGTEIKTITDYPTMREFLTSVDTIIGHNFIRYDAVQAEKILDIKIEARIIDTLALSWALYPTRSGKKPHGLDSWGVDFGVPKPIIEDWVGLPVEEYVHRCEEDVSINTHLWDKISQDLALLYNNDSKVITRLINYLSFKLDCIRGQEATKIKFDIEGAIKLLDRLNGLKQPLYDNLELIMPDVPIYAVRTYPAKPKKKDGNLSATGLRWIELLKSLSLPGSHKEPIKVITGYDKPNPDSYGQIKAWLYSLGWEPSYYKANKDGKDVPQIRLEDKSLCPAILSLGERVPELLELIDFLNVSNAIKVLKNKKEDGGLIINQKDGYIAASIGGFTNTLRFKHKIIANLPKPSVPWGKEIRSLFICEDDETMAGSDLSGLEARLKMHYIYPYDPGYVKSMDTEGYDDHLSLAVSAGALTESQSQAHKDGTEDYTDVRHLYKTTNYSAQYGVGAPSLSKRLKIPKYKAVELLNAYWVLNQSIKSFADDQVTKKCLGVTWVLNPVSGFWYQLRAKKDIFSTIVQSTGAYIFDLWVRESINAGIKVRLQMHDEIMFTRNKHKYTKEATTLLLNTAINNVNDSLCLNKAMGIDTHFGKNYSEVH